MEPCRDRVGQGAGTEKLVHQASVAESRRMLTSRWYSRSDGTSVARWKQHVCGPLATHRRAKGAVASSSGDDIRFLFAG